MGIYLLMTEKEAERRLDKVARNGQGDRTSENTSKDSVIGADRKDHQEIHQEASEAGKTFGTFSDNKDDQSFQAIKPGETKEEYQARQKEISKRKVEPLQLFDSQTGEVHYDASKRNIENKNPSEQAIKTETENMTTGQVKALGGKDAQMMFDAVDKMPDGPEKHKAREALKASYSSVLDEAEMEGMASKPYLEGYISNTPEDSEAQVGWFEAAQKIAQLPLDKQIEVIGAGLTSGITEYNRQHQERAIGAVIGAVQGVGEVATNLAKVADFSAYCILQDDRAIPMAEEFGESLGKTVAGGLILFDSAHKYLNGIGEAGYRGDYTKVFRDISTLGENLDRAWSDLSPREQSRVLTKLTTELAADGIIGLGAARSISKSSKITEVLDTVSSEIKDLHKAGKAVSKNALDSVHEALNPVVDKLRQRIGPRWAHATAYGGEITAGAHGAEEIGKGAYILEKRLFQSKFDPTHRLKPIEAARENARLRGEPFDEARWKKLTPDEKAKKLEKEGYKQIEDPEKPRELVDSRELTDAYRGDRLLYSELDENGLRKAHLNARGDLEAANPSGIHDGKEVTLQQHILGSKNPGAKENSPFISVGTKGVLLKYGKTGEGIRIDLGALREAIACGEVKDVEFIEHIELLDQIQKSSLGTFGKKLATNFAKSDNEFLIKGTVPSRFISIERGLKKK